MNAGTTKESFLIRYRYWIMLLGIVVFLPPLSVVFQFTKDSSFCGLWCPRMFFVWRQGTTVGQYLMGFLRSYMGVTLVLGVLLTTFFFGRYFCSHLCPIGGTTETGSMLVPRFLKINYSDIPSLPVRYGYFSVYLLAPLVGIGSICCSYCNFATIPRLFGSAFSHADAAYFLRTAGIINLGLIVVLGFLARGGRAYCNLLCPIGALDAISNRLGSKFGKRVRVDMSKCDACGACQEVCPMWSIDVKEKAKVDQLSCIPCRICEKICPKDAVRYGPIKR